MTSAMNRPFTDQADLRMYALELFNPDHIDVRKDHIRYRHEPSLGARVPARVERQR